LSRAAADAAGLSREASWHPANIMVHLTPAAPSRRSGRALARCRSRLWSCRFGVLRAPWAV